MRLMHVCVVAQTLLSLPVVCMKVVLQINSGSHTIVVKFYQKVTEILTTTAASPCKQGEEEVTLRQLFCCHTSENNVHSLLMHCLKKSKNKQRDNKHTCQKTNKQRRQ